MSLLLAAFEELLGDRLQGRQEVRDLALLPDRLPHEEPVERHLLDLHGGLQLDDEEHAVARRKRSGPDLEAVHSRQVRRGAVLHVRHVARGALRDLADPVAQEDEAGEEDRDVHGIDQSPPGELEVNGVLKQGVVQHDLGGRPQHRDEVEDHHRHRVRDRDEDIKSCQLAPRREGEGEEQQGLL